MFLSIFFHHTVSVSHMRSISIFIKIILLFCFQIPFFDDVGAVTLQYFDTLFQRDNLQKSQFFKGLPKVLPKLPKVCCCFFKQMVPSLCFIICCLPLVCREGRCMCVFLAVLGLCCYMGFSLVVASRGYSLVVMHRFPIPVASLVAEHRLNRCGAWPQFLCGMWDLSVSGIKLVSPTLVGGFFSTGATREP